MSGALVALMLTSLLVLWAAASSAEGLRTNIGNALVPLDEIIAGGPPPDGIPAIDRPTFVSFAAADGWLHGNEPVLALQIEGDARAYPLQILMWHEIVNDVVGGKAVAVTYCPLCNSALVFLRAVAGVTLDFGTSGKLYKSDLLMYDRQTHSLWAQMEGRAVVGDRAGTRLTPVSANTIAYEDFKAIFPRGRVLSRETGHRRAYGRNPYERYDQPDTIPFLFRGELDRRRPPKERVVGIVAGEVAKAYPWPILEQRGVIQDTVAGMRLVIFHRAGALSALDDPVMATSRAIGATAVFSPIMDGQVLTFERAPGGFRDRETASVWNFLGLAIEGAAAGKRLRPIPHVDAFWFAWAAFYPKTSLHAPP
jgi:Protein of unknown function (DUF3179)